MIDSTIINPFPTITFAEIVDIIFVAVLLYTAIVWARQTRAAFVVRGILILGGIYILARYLDLQMTAWVFQGFFAIFLIMIVVIFQEELRQFFERIAVWSLTRKRVPALGSNTADILVRTLSDLAKEHVGALIVIRGNDPLERHITGGIPLEGKLSGPLLKSIFDSHSPGHDGAVLVEQDAITRFAAHLPLSKNLTQLTHVGTRHSAALGLAELTDALCIVVSEERGTISVARDGTLREVENLQQLGAAIESFLRTKFPSTQQSNLSLQFFRENWIAKAISLSLAIGFWYIFVPGSKTVQVSYRIPVSVENLPANLRVEEIEPPVINATFSGPRRAFYLFDPSRIRVAIDVSMAELGRRTFNISEQNIRYPKELTLQELNPSTLRLSVKKIPDAAETNRG
ncbi:MAG TPA: diadenylate cyclase [Candidatus Binatia bacterium]|jgi:diadenylate cyclase|nr:diadenylate cyclase [Candidatus Binatia bacterium]